MDRPTIRIRRAALADAAELAAFAARTFEETFGRDNRPEDTAAHLSKSFGVPQQSRELADPGVITLLAFEGRGLIAYAQVRRSKAPPCVSAPRAVELQRFYVDRPAHGRGVAQQLMTAALGAARELGAEQLWLSVWERNPRAIAFYRKAGFVDVGSTDFVVGSDRQTDRVLLVAVPGPSALVPASEAHLAELATWFPDAPSCAVWAGPDFRYPFTPETFREDVRIADLPTFALVGEGGELLGFGQYYLRVGRCHLARIAVSPHHRGRRHGETLLRELCRLGSAALGVNECSLFVLEDNAPALRLYRRLGFEDATYPETMPPIAGCLYMVAPSPRAAGDSVSRQTLPP